LARHEFFGRTFISRQICQRTIKKIVEKKRRLNKNTSFSEILKTTFFFHKICKQEFQQNKPEATAMAWTQAKPPEFSPEIQFRRRAPKNGL